MSGGSGHDFVSDTSNDNNFLNGDDGDDVLTTVSSADPNEAHFNTQVGGAGFDMPSTSTATASCLAATTTTF